MPECQKNKKGGLDQYGAKRFGIDSFATIRKSVGLKGLSCYLFRQQSSDEISAGVWTKSLTTPLCFGGWADAYELLMSLISSVMMMAYGSDVTARAADRVHTARSSMQEQAETGHAWFDAPSTPETVLHADGRQYSFVEEPRRIRR